jgi:hypothetical protein
MARISCGVTSIWCSARVRLDQADDLSPGAARAPAATARHFHQHRRTPRPNLTLARLDASIRSGIHLRDALAQI